MKEDTSLHALQKSKGLKGILHPYAKNQTSWIKQISSKKLPKLTNKVT